MDDLFEAAGSLRAAYAAVDWSATTLGAVSSWSPTLRTTIDLALHSRFPVTLLWGPDLVMVYNEAYVQLIGDKHPAALGAPAAQVFLEIWDTIGPMLTAVLSTHGATMAEDLRLLMDRHGFLEECYFTFCYSAVRGPEGKVEGIIDIATETTPQILSHRRLELLARLTDELSTVETTEDILRRAHAMLHTAPHDLPDVDIVPAAAPAPVAGTLSPAVPPAELRAHELLVESSTGAAVAWMRLASPPKGLVFRARLSAHLAADDAYLDFVGLIGAALTQAFTRSQSRQAEQRIAQLQREMSQALQHSLLTEPAQPDNLQVAVRYHSAVEQAHIGGDWYDSFLLPGGSLALAVGDVTGHDRRAAAAMAQIRNLLRGIAYDRQKPPAAVLSMLDAAMRGLNVGVLASAVLARVEQNDQQAARGLWTLRWSNAGHPPPALIDPAGTVTLLRTPPDLLLGVRSDTARHDHTTTLTAGSTVVLYTDGLVERRDQIIDAGLAELAHTLTGGHHLSAEDLCDLLLAHRADTSGDDIALVVLRMPSRNTERPEPAR